MKITKERLIRIINEEVAALREGRFSDITKPVTDNPTKYKIPPKNIPDKSYASGDQKGAYQEPPEYPMGDYDQFYFGDTLSETILDMIADNVGEDNPELDSMQFVEKLTRYIYNQLRREMGDPLWDQLEAEWDSKNHTQGEEDLISSGAAQRWMAEKMEQHTTLNNAVMTAYNKFADMADPEGFHK